MPTVRQKKAAKLIIANATLDKPLNGGEIVEKSGYAPIVSKNPHQVLESDGVKEELAANGFTPEAAKSVVSEIMNNGEVEPNARLKAADMTFKVHGTYAPEKTVTLNLDIKVDDKDLSLAQQILEQRNQRGSEGGSTQSDGALPQPVGGEVPN